MSWGRIDDGFDDHPKVLALLEHDQGGAAVGLWTLCFTWAHRNTRKRGKTPGLIPGSLPRRYLGPGARELAALLVSVRLWDEAEDGWLIHDFEGYLTTETREARAEAGRRGAAKRWGAKAEPGNEPSGDSNLPSDDGNQPEPCHDVDGKPIASDGSRAPARWAIPNGIAPTPTPNPIQPSAAAAKPQPDARNLTDTQRSKRLTDAYAEAEPMCKWPAVNGVVLSAIRSGRFSDEEIRDALLRLAAEGRSVTIDSLRTELRGFAPRNRASPRQSAADRSVAEARALKERLRNREPA